MSIVLSHRTARLYHHCPLRPDEPEALPPRRKKLRTEAADVIDAQDARVKLSRLGAPSAELETLDILVSDASLRRQVKGMRCHVTECELPAGSILKIGGGIFVADIRLTALQAAGELSFWELVEYYFELCGAYELPFDPEDDYLERPPLTTIAELDRYFTAVKHMPGLAAARRALKYVREGARSPMETALVMTLVLPKGDGGLGLRGIKMNHEVDVGSRAAHLTRRHKFFLDAYLPQARLDIEYHGFFHDEDQRASEDDERACALRAMGYQVIPIRRWTFFDRNSFERFSVAVMRKAKIPPCRLPKGFNAKRERLRQFVLRRYL